MLDTCRRDDFAACQAVPDVVAGCVEARARVAECGPGRATAGGAGARLSTCRRAAPVGGRVACGVSTVLGGTARFARAFSREHRYREGIAIMSPFDVPNGVRI